MSNLTAFLIVRNEEQLLPRCLASLNHVVDAIVALDTGSGDRTRAILARFAADPEMPPLHWESHAFVDFGQTRQAALDLVRTEWALWIDADECLTPALAHELRCLRAGASWEDHDVYLIPLENRVYGRLMRGRNLAGQLRPRLFRTRLGQITAAAVHESTRLPTASRQGRLTAPLRHDTLTSWRRYLAKVDLYTRFEVLSGPRRHPLYLLGHLLVTGPATFWREYIWRKGFRDGWPGLVWAAATVWSSVLRDLKRLGWRRPGPGA